MRKLSTLASLAVLSLAAGSILLATMNRATGQMAGMPGGAMTMPMSMPAPITRAVAVIYPTKGNTVSGTIWFDKTANGVHVHGTISGLDPKSVHAFHIHEFGDASSDDGMAAGSHYNPEGHPHGTADAAVHHAGDLGNVTADDTGKATVDLNLTDVSIADPMKDPIVGRGLVIHAKADDFSQPVGNAGGRIGVGVIGIAKPAP